MTLGRFNIVTGGHESGEFCKRRSHTTVTDDYHGSRGLPLRGPLVVEGGVSLRGPDSRPTGNRGLLLSGLRPILDPSKRLLWLRRVTRVASGEMSSRRRSPSMGGVRVGGVLQSVGKTILRQPSPWSRPCPDSRGREILQGRRETESQRGRYFTL